MDELTITVTLKKIYDRATGKGRMHLVFCPADVLVNGRRQGEIRPATGGGIELIHLGDRGEEQAHDVWYLSPEVLWEAFVEALQTEKQ